MLKHVASSFFNSQDSEATFSPQKILFGEQMGRRESLANSSRKSVDSPKGWPTVGNRKNDVLPFKYKHRAGRHVVG